MEADAPRYVRSEPQVMSPKRIQLGFGAEPTAPFATGAGVEATATETADQALDRRFARQAERLRRRAEEAAHDRIFGATDPPTPPAGGSAPRDDDVVETANPFAAVSRPSPFGIGAGLTRPAPWDGGSPVVPVASTVASFVPVGRDVLPQSSGVAPSTGSSSWVVVEAPPALAPGMWQNGTPAGATGNSFETEAPREAPTDTIGLLPDIATRGVTGNSFPPLDPSLGVPSTAQTLLPNPAPLGSLTVSDAPPLQMQNRCPSNAVGGSGSLDDA